MLKPNSHKGLQFYSLLVLRILVGWYFLYEGIVKLLDQNWSAYAYLKNAHGLLSDYWSSLADNQLLLNIINQFNTFGLIAIGLGLILGLFCRIASVSGGLLVLLYYLSYPPIIAAQSVQLTGDHVLWVDKNLIFMAVFVVLYAFPTSQIIGVDRLIFKKKNSIDGQQ